MDEATNSVAEIDLGGGLVLRSGRVDDAPAVAALVVLAHASKGNKADAAGVWVRDLMERPHPTMRVSDVLVVQDRASGAIVSTLNVIPQTWTYAGIPLGVSRMELVATHPAYEGRGLIRRQVDAYHQLSARRGHLLQAISGIPSYYRQYGYEYALQLGGGWTGNRSQIQLVASEVSEPFHFQLATDADLSAIRHLDEQAQSRSLVSCTRDVAGWRYELGGRDGSSMLHSKVLVIERGSDRADRTVVGFAVVGSGGFPGVEPGGPVARVHRFEVVAGTSWHAATEALLRQLTGAMTSRHALSPGLSGHQEVALILGESHPSYDAGRNVLRRPVKASAWYVRIPNLLEFLHQVTPVLEKRLAQSSLAGYSGTIPVTFYHSGLRLNAEQGRLHWADWSMVGFRGALVAFPELTFYKLLLGYRSFEDLMFIYPDCWAATEEARLLLDALFPTQPSAVWPIG
jgi:hypothetical protein